MDYYKEEAYKEALKSPMKNKYGAVIVHRKKIIAYGHNKYKGDITCQRVLCCWNVNTCGN